MPCIGDSEGLCGLDEKDSSEPDASINEFPLVSDGYAAPQSLRRRWILDLRIASGLSLLCILAYKPQALHNGWPFSFFRQSGVCVCPQLMH